MGLETVELRIERGVMHVTFNRPGARNALSRAMVAELEQAFAQADLDDEARVIVLRGAGGHFCAGADLADMLAARVEAGSDAAAIAAINRGFGRLIEAVDASPKTVVAVLEGAVLGGGLGLACVADIALAVRDSQLGLPETTIGLIPAQIIPFVVARVGLSEARRLALGGERIDGAEALRIGLAHALAADDQALEEHLAKILGQALRCAPQASRQTKALLLATRDTATGELLDEGARVFAEAANGLEAAEGTRAFLEKRRPSWVEGSE